LAYLTVALPGSALGLIWAVMRLSLHEPLGALGILLAFGVAASVVSSAATGQLLSHLSVGMVLVFGTMFSALALAVEAVAPSLWVVACGFVLGGVGFGATDSALNVHAARYFGARQINWMHASYGLGATIGPLLVTVLLNNGMGWRWTIGAMALILAPLAWVFTLTRRSWALPVPALEPATPSTDEGARGPSMAAEHRKPLFGVVLSGLTFAALETGIESGAGIWGYVFLTSGRGLSHVAAGVAVSAYWAMMFVGRAVLGPVAEHVGAARVLASAVVGVPLGAALMLAPFSSFVAVLGLMTIGLAAAPLFPLLTLTTGNRMGVGNITGTTRTVSFQVASSAIGAAALPAGIGIVIGALNAKALAPSLLVLGLVLCAVYGLLSRLARRSAI